MTELKIKKEMVNIIDSEFFNIFIWEYYNKPNYRVEATLECTKDTVYLFNIKKEKMDEWNYKRLFDAPDRLLTDLCYSGVIEEGLYLIKVSW